MHTPRRGRFSVDDAVVSAVDVGEGPAVLLIHGIPTSAALWSDIVGPLADAGRRAIAADLPGYGRTRPGSRDQWSLAGAARLLARWIRQDELGPLWVVGHDAGGAVAQLLAVEHPDVVSRLTLVDSIADTTWPAPRARFARLAARLGLFRPAAALGLVPNRFLRWQVSRGFAAADQLVDVDEDAVFWHEAFTSPTGRRAFQRHVAALDWDATSRVVPGLGELEVPSQLVWGTEDVFQPWSTAGVRLLQLLSSPTVDLLDGCGHFVPLECPQRLTTALLRWRTEVPT